MASATSEVREVWIVGPAYGETHRLGASRTVLNITHSPGDLSSISCHYYNYYDIRPGELSSEKWKKDDPRYADLTMTKVGRRLETAIECSAPLEMIEMLVKALGTPLSKNILDYVVCIRGGDVCVERTSAAARFHIDQSVEATIRKVEALFTFLMSRGAELQPTIFERLLTGNMPAEARLPMLEMLFKMYDARVVPIPKNLFDIALTNCFPFETGETKSEKKHNSPEVLRFLLAHNFRPVNLTQEAIIADITSATIKLRIPFEILEILIRTDAACRKILLRYFLFNLKHRLPDDAKILELVINHAERSELESCLFDVIFLYLEEEPKRGERLLRLLAERGVQVSAEAFIRQLLRSDWIRVPHPLGIETSTRLPLNQRYIEEILISLSKVGIQISREGLREIIIRVGEEDGIHPAYIQILVTEGYLVPTKELFKHAATKYTLDVVEFLVSRSEPALLADVQLNIIPWCIVPNVEVCLKVFRLLSARGVPPASADTLVEHICERYVISALIIERLLIFFPRLGLALSQKHVCDFLVAAYKNEKLRKEDIQALVRGEHLCIDEELYSHSLKHAPQPVVEFLLDANPRLRKQASLSDVHSLVLCDEYKASVDVISFVGGQAAAHDNP